VISVIIPTVPGREGIFERVRAAYMASFRGTDREFEILVEWDHPTVGCAWQAGAEKARGDYIHMGNDDCEPWPMWWRDAVEAADRGLLPSPMVRNDQGYPQALPKWGQVADDWTPVECATIPFLSRAQWEAVQPLLLSHYYSDNFITTRAKAAGYECVLRLGYAFTHFWATERRGAGMASQFDRDTYDKHLYGRALDMVARGQWTAPWPAGGHA
jgi:hypothetical protein